MARTKLTITSPIETKKTSKDKPFYTFKAKDGDKEFTYSTFSQTIGATLVQGIQCEAEIEEREHTGGDGTVYKNRTVNQVWIDGKPVREEKKTYSGRGKSPEEEAFTNRRTALMQAVQFCCSPNIEIPNLNLMDFTVGILQTAGIFNDFLENGKVPKVITEAIEIKEPPQDGFDNIPGATKEQVIINTVGDLFTLCNKNWKMTATQVLKELGITNQKDIKNLATAYLTIKSIKEPK